MGALWSDTDPLYLSLSVSFSPSLSPSLSSFPSLPLLLFLGLLYSQPKASAIFERRQSRQINKVYTRYTPFIHLHCRICTYIYPLTPNTPLTTPYTLSKPLNTPYIHPIYALHTPYITPGIECSTITNIGYMYPSSSFYRLALWWARRYRMCLKVIGATLALSFNSITGMLTDLSSWLCHDPHERCALVVTMVVRYVN